MRPGLVDAASDAALNLLGQVLPGLGHGLVAKGDEEEMINRDRGAWKAHPQGLPERGRRVDRDDLHSGAPSQRAGEEPVSDALVVPAIDDTQYLPGVQVNDGCHPRLMPNPRARSGVAEEPHGPEPVFIDTQHPRAELIHVGQGGQVGLVQRGPHRPPRDPERGRHLRDGMAGPDDRVNDLVPVPAGGPRPAGDLGGGFKEREPRTGRRLAVPAVLGPEDLHGPGNRDIPDPLETLLLPPRCHDTAGGAARGLVGFDNDPAPAIGQHAGRDDAVVGQVEDAGGSVRRHPGRLIQGSWSCPWLNA